MFFLLLIPILIYLFFILTNQELFGRLDTVFLFGYQIEHVPALSLSMAFIIIWTLLVSLLSMGIQSYLRHKIKKLEHEITTLKSELYSGQSRLINEIRESIKESVDEIRKDQNLAFQKMIHFNQYTLEKIITENDVKFETYKKESQKLLGGEEISEGGWIEKVKKWK